METDQLNPNEQVNHIRNMMERSSRFISLSGWSGISAGTAALIGAYFARKSIRHYYLTDYMLGTSTPVNLFNELFLIATLVFLVALISAFLFTYIQSKKEGVAIWGSTAKRLLWNTLLPVAIGGIFILKLVNDNQYQYVSASCLLFYGLGLVNGSKYTLGEVRYLGYAQLLLGLICLMFPKHELLFWTLGFGVCHIVYGFIMKR